jgi:D-beta-D-heptose 7-phosphate kinase/D-beta-D-heptose 1-phosphate adenosyltransferase
VDTTSKIAPASQAAAAARRRRAEGGRVVFTNGCFDLLHAGHVRYLEQARSLGELLVVGLNSDASVRALAKAPERPLVPQDQRAAVLAGLAAVDLVVVFDQPTPAELIAQVRPDVLVKGGDWPPEAIVGAEAVQAGGGRVLSLPLVEGISTTALVERIRRGPAREGVSR